MTVQLLRALRTNNHSEPKPRRGKIDAINVELENIREYLHDDNFKLE